MDLGGDSVSGTAVSRSIGVRYCEVSVFAVCRDAAAALDMTLLMIKLSGGKRLRGHRGLPSTRALGVHFAAAGGWRL